MSKKCGLFSTKNSIFYKLISVKITHLYTSDLQNIKKMVHFEESLAVVNI